ncbi:MAG: DNA-processing protein DprA [Clostridia bacterium]|nr:DNA-processing protein DprA [Clostridia bacterium]
MDNIQKLNLIWLDMFDFLTYRKKVSICEECGVTIDIRRNITKNKTKLLNIISEQEYFKMEALSDDESMNSALKEYEKESIQVLCVYDKEYPSLLKEINNPPLLLYCKGNIQLLNTECVGIVGTRKPTDYGKLETRIFTKKLAENGLTIVSGMSMGVDAIAHATTLEVKGKTIAVLAGGFYHVYPAMNMNLFKKIIENNLAITENRPSVSIQPYMFPVRNRIIAGLSRGVLLTEAGVSSGSIHTRNYAIEFNREIFAIPGKLSSLESEGCNRTIKEFSTSIVLSPNDILDVLHIDYSKNTNKNDFQLDFSEQTIIKYIKSDKKSFQDLLEHTHLVPNQLNAILISLQMKGLIDKLPGNYYLAN